MAAEKEKEKDQDKGKEKENEKTTFSVAVGLYKTFEKQLKGTETPFKSVVLSLLVLAVEQFFSKIVFTCPEKNYVAYGVLFIVGPFVILFCISMQVSKGFWALATGCCRAPFNRQTVIWVRSSRSLFLATLPPLLWLVFAFASMDFYVCAKLGSIKIDKENKNDTEKAKIDKKFNRAKSESQIIAWSLLISFVVFLTILITVRRLCKKDRDFQGEEDYDKYEAEEAVTYFNGRLKSISKEEAQKFVDSVLEKYKDRANRVHMCEKDLEARYPYHSGVVVGQYRISGTDNGSTTIASKKRRDPDNDGLTTTASKKSRDPDDDGLTTTASKKSRDPDDDGLTTTASKKSRDPDNDKETSF